ncbi:sarcosine oxidase subunit gamma [Candidatus Pelagibacter communis]|uniref:sarcosine oxidase subunit gamma n=1 Tax=Pelagibacter ubique TaxID=198252 RepID=UPI00094C2565|nr:sarcosine oxidase subunit gamma family protein [Candidatus Pelagibacter ubique]
MTNTSPLNFVHKVGKFGDTNKKIQNNILKVSEINGLLIFQILQYKNSSFDVSKIRLDGLSFPSSLKSTSNSNTRILWIGPNNWLVFSSVLDLLEKEKNQFNEADFAITDISHSRTIIELEGNLVNEVLKKGCPLDISSLKDGDCANSVYKGINITIDFISESPKKVRILGLRSYGESLHHSVTDACLEFGYDAI